MPGQNDSVLGAVREGVRDVVDQLAQPELLQVAYIVAQPVETDNLHTASMRQRLQDWLNALPS